MKNKKTYLYLMIVISILLCIPSILYLAVNKTVDGFDSYYTYSLLKTENLATGILSGTIVIGLLLLFSLLYFLIVKEEKNIFKNKKQIIIFITIISFIFMLILPYLSSDIYYYIGDSWVCSKYHENPYYTSVKDLQANGINDEILNNTGYWKATTSVYGPIWNIISTLLVSLSFGKITLALFIFKIASMIIHVSNCVIIKKITKSNKYMLLYGLNPLVLIELLSNVHNDVYLIFFLLVSLYYLIKKKNIYLTILFLILSIAIKYSTVLIVPFILLYYFRKKSIPKRILYCCISGIVIIVSVALLYLPFYRDITIFKNMLAQDEKFSQSIMSLLVVKMKNNSIFDKINKHKIHLFAIIYGSLVVRTLFKRKFNFKYVMKKYNISMLIFIFICLTTFQRWYVLWLLPTIMWQNKKMKNFILNLTILGIIPSFIFFLVGNESYKLGIYYSITIIMLALIFTLIEAKLKKGERNVKISFNRWK